VRAAVSGRSRWSRAQYQILTDYIADWELDRVETAGKAHAASDGDQKQISKLTPWLSDAHLAEVTAP